MRRERAAGIVVVVLGIVVAVVAIIALREPNGHNSASPTRTDTTTLPVSKSAASSSAGPSGSRTTPGASPSATGTGPTGSTGSTSSTAAKSVPLVVLNNTTIPKLAAQAAERFEAGGWTVTRSGNLTNNIISTCAYYDPDAAGAEAAAKALQAQYPTIKRVAPKFDGLPAGPVVVVLTPDYSAN